MSEKSLSTILYAMFKDGIFGTFDEYNIRYKEMFKAANRDTFIRKIYHLLYETSDIDEQYRLRVEIRNMEPEERYSDTFY